MQHFSDEDRSAMRFLRALISEATGKMVAEDCPLQRIATAKFLAQPLKTLSVIPAHGINQLLNKLWEDANGYESPLAKEMLGEELYNAALTAAYADLTLLQTWLEVMPTFMTRLNALRKEKGLEAI